MNKVSRSELQAKYGDEKVWVLNSDDLAEYSEGFSLARQSELGYLHRDGFFANRFEVEYNTEVRQPIPYILVRNNGRIFATTRLLGSGEARLHGKISIGMGGHINPVDNYGGNLFLNALYRELDEELNIPKETKFTTNFIGIINDNSNPVSQDHLALVFVVDINRDDVTVRETDKHEGGFYTINELVENVDKLESWSQVVLDAISRGYIN